MTAEQLARRAAEEPAFDRFYFNLHGLTADDPVLIFGAGVYPPKGLADGYALLRVGGEQRNLRFSDHLDGAGGVGVGPLEWETAVDGETWSLRFRPNPIGLELDVEWRARAPRIEPIEFRTTESAYDHWFQSGRYTGTLTVDGERIDVTGWFGQRDRSRGRRAVGDRLGMHLWLQAQFADESIGVLFNEGRDGRPVHCEGRVMREDGSLSAIVSVAHALTYDDDFELHDGELLLGLEKGRERRVQLRSPGRGLYMDGGGYGGWHGADHGPNAVEHERWPLDGSRTPRTLGISLTDAFCTFEDDGATGAGICEYALTRSPSYTYRPTLHT